MRPIAGLVALRTTGNSFLPGCCLPHGCPAVRARSYIGGPVKRS